MMRNFDLRIKISASAQKLKVVFDFREMTWDRTVAEQTTRLLLALGNAEVEWIVGELFPELDGFELKSEALAARMFVFEHQDEFRVLVDPKKPEKGRRLYLFTILSGFIPGMCTASTFLRSFTFSITLYLPCGSRVTRSVQDPTSTASKHSSALVFSRTPSIHLCLVPLTMHRCKSSTLPVLYPTGAVKDT